jgi:hypothetical protein
MTQSGLMVAFAGPNAPVTTVLREVEESLCFQRQSKLLFVCQHSNNAILANSSMLD